MGFAGRSSRSPEQSEGEAISHVAGDCFVLKDAGAIANYAPRNTCTCAALRRKCRCDCPKVETYPATSTWLTRAAR